MSTRVLVACVVVLLMATIANGQDHPTGHVMAPVDLTQGILKVSGCGGGQNPNVICKPPRLAPDGLLLTTPGAGAGVIDVSLVTPLPDTTGQRGPKRRTLEFDYLIKGVPDDKDGHTGLSVAAVVAGQEVSVNRVANGISHVVLGLPEGHAAGDTLIVRFRVLDQGSPISIAIANPIITDTPDSFHARGIGGARGHHPFPEVPRLVQVTLDVFFYCIWDVLHIPDRIGVTLQGPVTHDLLLNYAMDFQRGTYLRTVIRYQGVAPLVTGRYERFFYHANIDAREWDIGHGNEYLVSPECARGDRTLHGRPAVSTDVTVAPSAFHERTSLRTFGVLEDGSSQLSLLAAVLLGTIADLPASGALPEPSPVCLSASCE